MNLAINTLAANSSRQDHLGSDDNDDGSCYEQALSTHDDIYSFMMQYSNKRLKTGATHQQSEEIAACNSNDRRVIELVTRNICLTFVKASCGKRQPTEEERIVLHALSSAMMSADIKTERLQDAMTRVFGISRQQQNRVMDSSKRDPTCRKTASSGKFAPLQSALDEVVSYLHNDSPLIELDKSRPDPFTGRYFYKRAGRMVKITCRRRLVRGTKKDLVADLKNSAFFGSLLQKIGRTINDKKLESCICKCMQARTISECCCSQCTEFDIVIDCWNRQRKQWHKQTPCHCTGCSSNKKSLYFNCSTSVAAFYDTVLCHKKKYLHLRLPHFSASEPAAIPHLRYWWYLCSLCTVSIA